MKVWEGKQVVVSYYLQQQQEDNRGEEEINYNGRTKLSIFLIHYIGAQLDLTQVMTLKKKKSEAQPLS